jgi:hypothetical protein
MQSRSENIPNSTADDKIPIGGGVDCIVVFMSDLTALPRRVSPQAASVQFVPLLSE